MKNVFMGALAGLIGLAGVCALPAHAQESPTSAIGSVQDFRGPIDRSVDYQRAEMIKRSRTGGYGPSSASVNYYDEVTNTEYTTNTGNVQSSSSTNAVNLTSTTTHVDQAGATNTTSGVVYTTGQTSFDAAQTAETQTSSVGTGNNSQSSSALTTH